MEHNKVQKIPFGAFSKAKFLVRVNYESCNRLQTLFKMVHLSCRHIYVVGQNEIQIKLKDKGNLESN